jgi:NAD(P)H-dependent FMN reductase
MSDSNRLRLQVIIGSTRPTRIGAMIAYWFAGVARSHDDFEVEVVDLMEWQLPMLTEPNHPRLGQYTQELTRRWSSTIDAADAYVIVTPEYNNSYTAPVKNALDHLYREWNDKPVGFVSYGGVAGGARAVQTLKEVVTTLKMLPVFEGVMVPFAPSHIDNGDFVTNDIIDASAVGMLNELSRIGRVLRELRRAA